MNKVTFLLQELPLEYRQLGNWPKVDEGGLPAKKRAGYLRNKASIEAFMAGESVRLLCKKLDLRPVVFYRNLKRCLTDHPDGRIWGFRALIPGIRVKSYERTKVLAPDTEGASGMFQLLLRRNPDLEKWLLNTYLKRADKDAVAEPKINISKLFQRFKDKCKELGVGNDEYPFTVKEAGKRSFYKYLEKLKDTNFRDYVLANYGLSAARTADATTTERERRIVSRPYERVELDGHRLHLRMILEEVSPTGIVISEFMERIWLILAIDVATRAVLGYHLCYRRQYSSDDVLETIAKSVKPSTPVPITIEGLAYKTGAGMPSNLYPNCQWRAFDEIAYDNAMSHLSPRVMENLREVLYCAVNAGRVAQPTGRAIVERFFKTLNSLGFHRLPSTTGSNPQDEAHRRGADSAAKENRISVDHIEQILAVIVSNYNATGHSEIFGYSPLDFIRVYDEQNPWPPRLIAPEKRDPLALRVLRVTVTVRGNVKKGKRPYVQFENAKYRSYVLSNNSSLIGHKLILHVYTEDLRSVRAFFEDHTELGLLKAQGVWANTKHDLTTRKTICKLRHDKLLTFANDEDPVRAYLVYLRKNMRDQPRLVNEFHRLKTLSNVETLPANDTYPRDVVTESAVQIASSNDATARDILRRLGRKTELF